MEVLKLRVASLKETADTTICIATLKHSLSLPHEDANYIVNAAKRQQSLTVEIPHRGQDRHVIMSNLNFVGFNASFV